MGRQLHFQSSSFPILMVLDLSCLEYLESVVFEDTMPKLELIQVGLCWELNAVSWLPALKSLKEILLDCNLQESVKAVVQRQVAEHMKQVRVNLLD